MRHIKTSRQRGWAMLETTIAFVIIAIVVGSIYVMFENSKRKADVDSNVEAITQISSEVQAKYGRLNRYAAVTTAVLVADETIPKQLRDGAGTTASNIYGGSISAAPATLTTANDAVALTWPNAPKGHCVDTVTRVAGVARRIAVDGTVVKPLDGELDLAALSTQCDGATAPVTYVFDIGRNAS